MLTYEKQLWQQGFTYIAGVDEAGAGPLAGPVVAAAVVLAPLKNPPAFWQQVNDSKKLSAKKREELAKLIQEAAVAVSVGSCSVEEIERLNILQAAKEAMRRAVVTLKVTPEHLLVDARHIPEITIPQLALIDGDARARSIAAASIIAKVTRDALMEELDALYPEYGFKVHKGYGTAKHLQALKTFGPCAIHRRTFKPVTQLLQKTFPT